MNKRVIARLKDIDCSTVKRFSFEGVSTYARVADVHDPDTITLVLPFNKEMIKLSVRLDGVDAPELTSKIKSETEACKAGTVALSSLIQDVVVEVQLGKFDKYGRVLARVNTLDPIIDDITCINEWMIRFQYVRSYSGGKKQEWSEAELKNVGIDKLT